MYRAVSHTPANAHNRPRMSHKQDQTAMYEQNVPAPAYTDLRRTKSSIPVRIYRRITKHETNYDPSTIPRISRREMKRQEKREQRKLEELQAYQRKQFTDQISRQLEVRQNERPIEPQLANKKSVRQRLRNTLRKTKKTSSQPIPSVPTTPVSDSYEPTSTPPHVDGFSDKQDLQRWFHGPADVEASGDRPAELDATSTFLHVNDSDINKTTFKDSFDLTHVPLPARSPSPCVSSIPQRGMTINEPPTTLSNKKMQCDSCHDAIKMTGFHYACDYCNGGDCLYCAKCANNGRTCRHELTERTRNIKRHPTNPQCVERKPLAIDRDSVISSEAHIELSAMHPHSILPPLKTTATVLSGEECEASSSKMQQHAESPTASIDMMKEFEAKRREQEICFREKEVTLREREAVLREREAWTATRERDAALVQQLHAAAMLQQRTEVGAQFSPVSPVSRQHSLVREIHPYSSSVPHAGHAISHPESCPTTPFAHKYDVSGLAPIGKGKSVDRTECGTPFPLSGSMANLSLGDHNVKTHASASKRKASGGSAGEASQSSSSTRQGKSASKRLASKGKDNEEYDDEDDGDSGSPKRQKQDLSGDHNQKIFACPYAKYDPVRYAGNNMGEIGYRGCAAGLFRDISRVKQHLKRTHHRPDFYCRRCFEKFPTDAGLQKHASSPRGCNVMECPYPELLDDSQQTKIHIKRPRKDPRELWFEIYEIIFPGAPLPQSPYVEREIPRNDAVDIVSSFIERFNQRLDLAEPGPSWLNMPHTRQWLNAQLRVTLQEMQAIQDYPMSTPSMNNLPISSPESGFSSRHSSQSSRASSCIAARNGSSNRQRSHSPVIARGQLRPALKVTTHNMAANLDAQSNSSISANSHAASSMFPKLPNHIQDDQGYSNGAGQSWRAGDEARLTADVNMHLREPASATSTRSTKSVSFAPTPPEPSSETERPDSSFMLQWPSIDEPMVENPVPTPNLFDFAAIDWSAHHYAHDPDQPTVFWPKPQSLHRKDSAYYTSSSAHNSRTSLFVPPQSQTQTFAPSNMSQEQLTYVDPSKLFMHPNAGGLDGSGGALSGSSGSALSADVQAYLNRDRYGDF